MALKNIFKFGKKEKEAEELKSTERSEEEKEIKVRPLKDRLATPKRGFFGKLKEAGEAFFA